MANLNKVMLIGRLTRDVEARSFANGGKVVNFGFAVSNRKKNSQSGQWEDDPVYVEIEAFNRGDFKLADRIEETMRKGQQIFIEGRLKLDQWKDKNNGENRSKLKVILDNFQYLEPKSGSGQGGGQGGSQGSGQGSGGRRAEGEVDNDYSSGEGTHGGSNYDDSIPF